MRVFMLSVNPEQVSHSCCCSRKGLVTGFTKPSFSCSKTFLWNAAWWTAHWAGETSGWQMSRGMRARPGHCLLWHLTRAFNIWSCYELWCSCREGTEWVIRSAFPACSVRLSIMWRCSCVWMCWAVAKQRVGVKSILFILHAFHASVL